MFRIGVGAQPLISFTFSGGIVLLQFCVIFKLIFFWVDQSCRCGCSTLPHRTHTALSPTRNPHNPLLSRPGAKMNALTFVCIHTRYARAVKQPSILNSDPISNLVTLTQRRCNHKLRRMDSLAVEIKKFVYGKSGYQLFARRESLNILIIFATIVPIIPQEK